MVRELQRFLGCEDDLDVIGKSLEDVGNAARLLETKASMVNLQINKTGKYTGNKIKLMELIDTGVDLEKSEGLVFEKVDDLKYLGATLSTINGWEK